MNRISFPIAHGAPVTAGHGQSRRTYQPSRLWADPDRVVGLVCLLLLPLALLVA